MEKCKVVICATLKTDKSFIVISISLKINTYS